MTCFKKCRYRMFVLMLTSLSLWSSTSVVAVSTNDISNDYPTITALHIHSVVYSRFANVDITSNVVNDHSVSRTAMFSVQIPERAFISNFTMRTGDDILYGVVKEKEEADKAYKEAEKAGETAGKVEQIPPLPGRDMKNFDIYMNVAANSTAVFRLSYQELIEKVLGKYTQKIHIEPRQVIDNITVVASYLEPEGMEGFWYALPGSEKYLSSSNIKMNTQVSASESKRELVYTPSVSEQMLHHTHEGITGDVVVKYVLLPPENVGGTLVINKGSFVHYFSPSELPVLDKNIVFIIDISGSMSGRKIEQVRRAMHSILFQLRERDMFNIILFSDSVIPWHKTPASATEEYKSSARQYVDTNLKAGGGTNINIALLTGLRDSTSLIDTGVDRANLIVFLTDGEQTVGELDENKILDNVERENPGGLVSIFSLGFGNGVQFKFLQNISLHNKGTAHRIYDDTDASEQLGEFFKSIESVTLKDLEFKYSNDIVVKEDLTETRFPYFFNGSEITVAGNIKRDVDLMVTPLVANIDAIGFDNTIVVEPTPRPPITGETSEFAERLWAYKKIKRLLNQALMSEGAEALHYNQKALSLSLRYNFVTPLTSLVVTGKVNSATGALGGHLGTARMHSFNTGYSSVYKRGYIADADVDMGIGGSIAVRCVSLPVIISSFLLITFSFV